MVRKDIRLCAVTRAPESALERSRWGGKDQHSYSVLLLTGLSFSTIVASLESERENLNMSSESQINNLQQRLICKSKQTASLHFY